MKKLFTVFVLSILFLSYGISNAQLLEQDFESSTTVADYVSTTPNNGQFNAIGSSGAGMVLSINTGGDNNKLRFARTGNAGSFSRTTDFSPLPNTLMYRFDLTISGNSTTQTTAAVFQVGSGFGTANSAEANVDTYARFTINLTATDGTFIIRDITNGVSSGNLSGTQTITWVLNNSGSTISYLAPDGTIETLADDKADIWAGTSRLFNDVNVQTTSQSMADLKFAFTAGTAVIDIDNILIDPVPTVPTSNLPSDITSNSFRANWTPVTGVTGYRVDVSTANDFSSFVTGFENLYVSGQSTSFVDVTGLDVDVTYYYRIRAASQYDLGEFASGNSSIQSAITTVNPLITLDTEFFSSNFGSIPSGEHSGFSSYFVSGVNLTDNITITPPTGFQIKTGANSFSSDAIVLTQAGGTVSSTQIDVRFSPGSTDNFSGNITHTSTDATTQNVPVSGKGIGANPTVQAGSIIFTNITPISFTINWTSGNGSNRIVLMKQGSAVSSNPVNETTYTANNNFGTGEEIGTGNFVVYNGDGNSVAITGLNFNTTYHIAIYEYNGGSGFENYMTPGAISSQLTTTPLITINADDFNSDFGVILVNTVSAHSSYTVSGSNLLSNIVISPPTGYQIRVSPDEFSTDDIVLSPVSGNVSTTSIDVRFAPGMSTGQISGDITHNSTDAAQQNVGVTGKSLDVVPTTQASNISFSNIGSITFTINWTNGDGSNRIVVMRQGSPVDAEPENGISYSANTAFGSGGEIGTGNFVVFNGATNTVSVTNLTSDNLYHIAIFEYNGGTNAQNYLTPAALSSQLTSIVIAGWEMNGLSVYGPSPFAPSNSIDNITIGGLTRGAGVGTSGSPAEHGWGGNGWDVSNLADAIAGNKFATFTISSNANYLLSLSGIAPYNIRRSGTGPTTGQWQYQINDGSFINIGSEITWGSTTTAAGNSQSAIDLSGIPALQNLSSETTVTFRIVNYGTTNAGGTWYINNFQTGDDFVVLGSVEEIPTEISVTPSTKNFGITSVGTSSESQEFTITNISGGTIQINSAVQLFGGDISQFNLTDNNSYPINLNNNQSFNVNVTFNPTSDGAKSTSLRIVTPERTEDIALTGTGWQAFGSNGQSGTNQYFFATSQGGIGAPSQPQYIWTAPGGTSVTLLQDRVASGLAVGNADDGRWDITIPAGVNFMIFGQEFGEGDVISIGTNGVYAFNNAFDASHGTTSSLPTATFQHVVMPLWMDLDPGSIDGPTVNRIWYQFRTTPTKELVITFENIAIKTDASVTNYVTFQSLIVYTDFIPTQNSLVKNQYNFDQSGTTFIENYNDGILPNHTIGIQGLNNAEQFIEYRRNTGPGIIFGSNLAVAFGNSDLILPVDLISFNANVDKNDVILKWSTSWEENNDRFEIKRKVHGDENASWMNVGVVAGAGTTTEMTSYSFTDKNLTTGKYEYKLVQFDNNGNTTSDFDLNSFVEVGVPVAFDMSQNYPNPFNPVTKINFEIPVEGLVKIVVFDIAGREVATLVNDVITPGYHVVEFNGSNFASGVYIYRLVTNNSVITKKLMLLK